MTGFEYKVVPAPVRGLKGKGIKGTPARFANALQSVMNELGAEGWEYQRTDTLPVEERQGLTGKATSFQNMLVFRRALVAPAHEDAAPIAALIEDHTDAGHTDEVPTNDGVAAPEDQDADAAADDAPADDTDPDPSTIAAQDRVSDTLEAPFVFPWNKRSAARKPNDDDTDPHVAAE